MEGNKLTPEHKAQIRAALERIRHRAFNGTGQTDDWVFVGDVARGVLAALDAIQTVGDGDLAEAIKELQHYRDAGTPMTFWAADIIIAATAHLQTLRGVDGEAKKAALDDLIAIIKGSDDVKRDCHVFMKRHSDTIYRALSTPETRQAVQVVTVEEFVSAILPSVPKTEDDIKTYRAVYQLIKSSGFVIKPDALEGRGGGGE